MYLYKTVFEYAEVEKTINRSRFIAHVSPAESCEEARAFISEVKERYRDATHNVPVFITGAGQENQWASDDGEPQGTSGMPVLKLVSDEGITNVAIVVTRYFGGIKLGTGGLARAYSGIAKQGIEAAGICSVHESVNLKYVLDYSSLARIQRASEEGIFQITGTEYADKITMTVNADSDRMAEICAFFNDVTAGRAVLERTEKGKIKIKIS